LNREAEDMTSADVPPIGIKRSLKQTAIIEFKQFVAIFLYLWLLFALFEYHKSIVLAQHNIDYKPYGFAFINAFVLAKVMLVAEKLNLGRKLRHRPLVFPILYKSIIFALILMSFEMVEETIVGVFRGKSVAESIPNIGGGTFAGLAIVAGIASVSLIPFFAYREVGRIIGRDELRAILLKARAN
jgi:hypothetical protein